MAYASRFRFYKIDPERVKFYKNFGFEEVTSGNYRAFALDYLAHIDRAIALLGQPGPLRASLDHSRGVQLTTKMTDRYINASACTLYIHLHGLAGT